LYSLPIPWAGQVYGIGSQPIVKPIITSVQRARSAQNDNSAHYGKAVPGNYRCGPCNLAALQPRPQTNRLLEQCHGAEAVEDQAAEDSEVGVTQQGAQSPDAGMAAEPALAGHQDDLFGPVFGLFDQVGQFENGAGSVIAACPFCCSAATSSL
jgi:hypothetical protein